jgi:hypothetical protein
MTLVACKGEQLLSPDCRPAIPTVGLGNYLYRITEVTFWSNKETRASRQTLLHTDDPRPRKTNENFDRLDVFI